MQIKKVFTFTHSNSHSPKNKTSLQPFSLSVELWPLRKKWKRGFKVLLLCWVGVPLFLFIPILHFILVPLSLCLGLGGFLFALRKEDRVLPQDTSCPLCHKAFPISPTNLSQFTFLVCSHCYERWDLSTPMVHGTSVTSK